MLSYLLIFFLFSYLGCVYEYILTGKCSSIIDKLFGIKLHALPMYGLGAAMLLYISRTNYSLFTKVVIAFFTINFMECCIGKLSHKLYNGYPNYPTWKYTRLPMCDGYISLPTAIWWTLLSFIFLVVLQKMKKDSIV